MQGWKTFIVALLMAVVPTVTQYLGTVDWSVLLPAPWNFVASAVVMIIMRSVTKTPMFSK